MELFFKFIFIYLFIIYFYYLELFLLSGLVVMNFFRYYESILFLHWFWKIILQDTPVWVGDCVLLHCFDMESLSNADLYISTSLISDLVKWYIYSVEHEQKWYLRSFKINHKVFCKPVFVFGLKDNMFQIEIALPPRIHKMILKPTCN